MCILLLLWIIYIKGIISEVTVSPDNATLSRIQLEVIGTQSKCGVQYERDACSKHRGEDSWGVGEEEREKKKTEHK